ncbi:hypothetical protein BDZ85DRAFT_256520 [Elsinoe ampelina]|uniref:Uncharacterized protein n=1 Tax=Elsinoe ampelina TaxID=302913 RepID=A0A6A6GLU6_9PEZI|nr:hypothetical protein BDZ85DRAFT_256520 [Elsinoe ampelina]
MTSWTRFRAWIRVFGICTFVRQLATSAFLGRYTCGLSTLSSHRPCLDVCHGDSPATMTPLWSHFWLFVLITGGKAWVNAIARYLLQ